MLSALSLLNNPTYRLLIGISAVGYFGLWLQSTTLTWFVYALTNSASQVGLISLFQWGPYAVLGLFSVSVADTFGLRPVLLLTWIGYASIALFLCVLALTENLTVFAIFASCFLRGLLMCVEQPARQRVIPTIVSSQDLPKILGFDAGLSSLALIAAPATAGIIIGTLGIRLCFILNVVACTTYLVGLYFLTIALPSDHAKAFNPISNLTEGLRIVARHREIATLLIVLLCVTTLPLSFQVILPTFADTTLGGGATTFGALMSSAGGGALLASLIITSRAMTVSTTLGCAVGIGAVQAALCFQTHFIPAALLIAIAGGCTVGLIVGTNATILIRTDKAVHGRVGGLFSYIVSAIGPLGSVAMGVIVSHGGAQAGLAVGAVIAVSSGVLGLFAIRKTRQHHIAD